MRWIWLCVAAAVAALVPQAQTGVLVVEASPHVAVVEVDSVLAGTVTPLVREVPAGARRLSVSRVGYAPFATTVMVPAGDTLVVRAELVRLAGTLDVRGLPPGARVLVRDTLYAGGPVGTGEVPLAVEMPGVPTARRFVPVHPGEPTVVEYVPRAFRAGVPLAALFTPGLAQARGGRPLVGALHAAAVLGGLALTGSALLASSGAASDREEAYEAYLAASDRDEAFLHWIEVEAALDRETRARRRIGPALGVTLAAHALGIADAVRRHGFSPRLRVTSRSATLAVPIR